jgi:hypothetical protein
MSYGQGSSNRLPYDCCAYEKRLAESVSPLEYQLYEGKYESCTKCIYDKFYRPFDLVDFESELKNITRPNTKCDSLKYNPSCKKSKSCISTFDPEVPIVFASEICPIVHNNIPKMTHPGYELDSSRIHLTCN